MKHLILLVLAIVALCIAALPPKHIYSADLDNRTDKYLKIVAEYSSPFESYTVEKLIAPHKQLFVEEKYGISPDGSSKLALHITNLAISSHSDPEMPAEDGLTLLHPFDGVRSPTKHYQIIIREEDGYLSV
eukprot:gnl/Dysnectes_brevis/2376_a2807_1615.p1 GENE.gnl/Dysnectes_brevis/2376_a2807_1615~~gnl/Dysnectes_brevis/2376_a2807_1615.p1  ORF type:complete len:131 (+),score=20.44 gnl/Dysnectes_brevis/2376_a2807_1615:234-626(+)